MSCGAFWTRMKACSSAHPCKHKQLAEPLHFFKLKLEISSTFSFSSFSPSFLDHRYSVVLKLLKVWINIGSIQITGSQIYTFSEGGKYVNKILSKWRKARDTLLDWNNKMIQLLTGHEWRKKPFSLERVQAELRWVIMLLFALQSLIQRICRLQLKWWKEILSDMDRPV